MEVFSKAGAGGFRRFLLCIGQAASPHPLFWIGLVLLAAAAFIWFPHSGPETGTKAPPGTGGAW